MYKGVMNMSLFTAMPAIMRTGSVEGGCAPLRCEGGIQGPGCGEEMMYLMHDVTVGPTRLRLFNATSLSR